MRVTSSKQLSGRSYAGPAMMFTSGALCRIYKLIWWNGGQMSELAAVVRAHSMHKRHLKTRMSGEDQGRAPKDRAKACVLQDRFETVLTQPEPEVCAAAESDNRKPSVNTELSERMSLLSIVGKESVAIRRSLEVCQKISLVVGDAQGAFDGPGGLRFSL